MLVFEGFVKWCGEICYFVVFCGFREYLYVDVIEGVGSFWFGSFRGCWEGFMILVIGKVFLVFNFDLFCSL